MHWLQHALPGGACAVCLRGPLLSALKKPECLIAAAYSGLKGALSDSPFHVTLCKASVSCVIAILASKITKNRTIWDQCGIGIASAGANTVADIVCNAACGKPDDTPVACYALTATLSVVGGCLAKYLGDVDKLAQHLLQIIITVGGHDFKELCKFSEVFD